MLLYGKKVKNNIFVYNIKVGRCSQSNEYMKHYEYQRSGSFIDRLPWQPVFHRCNNKCFATLPHATLKIYYFRLIMHRFFILSKWMGYFRP